MALALFIMVPAWAILAAMSTLDSQANPWLGLTIGGRIGGILRPGLWRQVSVIKIDAATGERLGLLATGIVGEGGWLTWLSRSWCGLSRPGQGADSGWKKS